MTDEVEILIYLLPVPFPFLHPGGMYFSLAVRLLQSLHSLLSISYFSVRDRYALCTRCLS